MTDFRRGEAGPDGNSPVEGRSPGLASAGGAQLQQQGLLGRMAQKAWKRWGNLFTGRSQKDCGPINNPLCADLTSEFLEQTFRNFHLNTAPRTNLAPPWLCEAIDTDPTGTFVAVNQQAFVTINSYFVQAGRIAVISHLGQTANTPAAFGDTTWRVVKLNAAQGTIATDGGEPIPPWNAMTGYQRFRSGGELLAKPIIVFGPMTVAWQVFVTTAGSAYNVAGRLWGWDYAPLSRSGNMIASAIAE